MKRFVVIDECLAHKVIFVTDTIERAKALAETNWEGSWQENDDDTIVWTAYHNTYGEVMAIFGYVGNEMVACIKAVDYVDDSNHDEWL